MEVRQGENVGFVGMLKTDSGNDINNLADYKAPNGSIKILIWSTNGGSVFLSSDDDRITINLDTKEISFGLRSEETAKLLGVCNFEMKLTTGTAETGASMIGVKSIFRVYQSNIGDL
jgi:hypothetical protein